MGAKEHEAKDGLADLRRAVKTGVEPSVIRLGLAAGPLDLAYLQRLAGNSAVVDLLSRSKTGPAEQAREAVPRASGGSPLPSGLLARLEGLSGEPMADVRVHRASPEPARVGAEAITYGADVYLAPSHDEHLAHEAWHVAQQKAGRVPRQTSVGGLPVNVDDNLEQEAASLASTLHGPEGAASGAPAPVDGHPARHHPIAPRIVGTPVAQGIFTKAQLRLIQKMRQDVRLEYLSHLSPKDLAEVADATNLFERFGGSEESDELRSLRSARAGQRYRRQWLGNIPPGNVREAARQMAHVGDSQAETPEEAERRDQEVDAFLAIVQGKLKVVFVEDCPLEDDESDDEDDQPQPGVSAPAKRVLPKHESAFVPPAPGRSLFLLGSVIASRDDPVETWKEHLRRGVAQSGETGELAGRYGPEPDDEVDALSEQLGRLGLGPTEVPTATGLVHGDPSSVVPPSSREFGGREPMDVDEPGAGEPMEVDVAADIVRVVLRGLHLPPPSTLPPDGVVAMDIDTEDVMAVDTEHPFDADIEMADAHGDLDVTTDEEGAITAVYGTLFMRMELVEESDQADVVFMDIDVSADHIQRDDAMDVSAGDDEAVMEIEATHASGSDRLGAAFLNYREPKKRKAEHSAPVLPPPIPRASEEGAQGSVRDDLEQEVEALTDQMSALQISFTTDLDDNSEQHFVGPDKELQEILLATNPKPLNSILKAKTWLGKPLPAGVIKTLTGLATTAAGALATFAKSRTKGSGKTLRQALRDIAKALKHVNTVAKMPAPDLSRSTNYGSNSDPTEGLLVIADKLSMNMKASFGHGPSADGRLMTAIRKRAGKEAKSYKQMHLLNDNVFGPGELWNLTPGPAQSNSEMEHGVETLLKRAIVDKALVLDFEAQVHYRNDPMVPTQGELDQDPDKYRFDRITFKAKQYDFDGAQWAGSKSPDSDVAAINKASSTVYWKWGSLTPLRAKPSVLTTTDVNELAGVMPKGLAARIVALNTYNNKNPGSPYAVTASKDKKGALLNALKDFEVGQLKKKSPKVVGWDKWKATEVLWN